MPEPNVMRIEPGAAERIARAFDQHADVLAEVAQRFRTYGYGTGFAGFPSAAELDAGFENKRYLAAAHLEHQEQVVRQHAASIRRAGANYQESDWAGAVGIADADPGADWKAGDT